MHSIVRVQGLVKRYADVVAVRGVSFEVRAGEIFGLLGPNGAGKTTTIRMMLHIILPDEGSVQLWSRSPAEVRERIGYLPEERGLYPNLTVIDTLVYLAELKGRPTRWARQQALRWLERVGLAERARAKVKELSRGMQQKVQFLASLVHGPDLLILDEPFQGLDPINVQLVKDILQELREQGKTIILSTHQMHHVEALCNRIALINRGQLVLYGPLEEIKRRYSPNMVYVRASGPLPDLPMATRVESRDGAYYVELPPETSPQAVLAALVQANVPVQSFQVAMLPLEEIFVRVVQEDQRAAA